MGEVVAQKAAKSAICLCGGGIVGGMYEIGALAALDDFLGDDRRPRASDEPWGRKDAAPGRRFSVNDFDCYVGTSAGSFLATVLASGIRARRLFRAALDDDPSFFPARRSDIYRFDWRQGLGILRDVGGVVISAAGRALRRNLDVAELITDFGDALPAGIFSLRHYEKFLDDFLRRHHLPTRFSEVPRELYITANDLDSGHRAILGQGALAEMPLAKAICASSAIPLFFEPVRYNGRDYVDGAVGKVEHADIALARGAELIVVVNPQMPVWNDPDREQMPTPIVGARHIRDKGLLAVYNQAGKMSTRTKLLNGIRRYQASHPQASLLLVEPRPEESDIFLSNPMSFSSRRRILRYGYESTAKLLFAERARWETAFARIGVRVDPRRLAPPWELTA